MRGGVFFDAADAKPVYFEGNDVGFVDCDQAVVAFGVEYAGSSFFRFGFEDSAA